MKMQQRSSLLVLFLAIHIELFHSFVKKGSIFSNIFLRKQSKNDRFFALSPNIQDFTSCIYHVKDIPLIQKKYRIQSIGSPRLIAPDSKGDCKEWSLWFQMRDDSFDDNLLPLSTGRIVYATSPDGIHDFQIHEDSPILHPSKDAGDWYYFDSEHVGLGDIIQAGSKIQSRFQSDSKVYLMYIFGGNSEKLSLPNPKNQTELQTILGTKMEIGIAVSQDGIHWSRVEGSSPYASIIERGKSPDDYDGLFIGWPNVIEVNNGYYLYYHTFNRLTNRYTICLATSSDGLLRWEKKGPIFDGNSNDPNAFDGKGATRRHIHRLADGTFRMYYEGVSSAGKHSIGIATSRDGYSWERLSNEPVFEAASSINAWDGGGVSSPHVIYLPDVKRWRLYYVGYPLQFINDGNQRKSSNLEDNGIGIAESLDETGVSFQRVVI